MTDSTHPSKTEHVFDGKIYLETYKRISRIYVFIFIGDSLRAHFLVFVIDKPTNFFSPLISSSLAKKFAIIITII